MTALELLKSIPHLPMFVRNGHVVKAGTSQMKRWLQDKAVQINGKRPAPNDELEFPITELVFFPKSKEKRCTLFQEIS